MFRKSNITIPRQPRPGLDLLPWCKDVNYAIKQLANTGITNPQRGRNSRQSSNIKPPFYVSIKNPEEDSYLAIVHPGYVYQVIPYGYEALTYHEPSNLYDGNKLTEFAISLDQAVYVKVELLEDGTIGSDDEMTNPSCSIVIQSNSASSTYYEPKVDDESSDGAVGTMYYKLAVLESGTPPILDRILSGSHICHHQDLPKIASTLELSSGVGVIPKEFDSTSGEYRLRALSNGLGQLTITTNADDVEVRGNKKLANLLVQRGDDSPEELPLIEFEDGLTKTGAESVGDEDPAIAPEEILIKIPSVVAGSGLTVENIGAEGNYVYEVSADGEIGEIISHPWKITRTAENTWLVKGGNIWGHNGEELIIVDDTIITTPAGLIYLGWERDNSTRQITSAVVFDFDGVEPDYPESQSFPLGYVEEDADPKIIQYQFQEVKIFEQLIITNGEFKLGNFQMIGYMNYNLPT
jgi:hypothetical protein